MKVIAKKNRELALINAQNTQNENRAETIELIIPEEYENYNKKIVFVTDDGIVWDIITNNEYKITNAITKYKQVDFYIWLTKEVDGESIDFRTKTKTLNFYHNEDASDEITDEEIHGVNTVVNLLEEEIEKVENLNIEATKIGSTTTVTITKKDGTTESVEINDGVDGKDGEDGKDAKINGKNSIEIEAGNNITIDNTETGIRINSTNDGGTTDYTDLENKPKINNVELSGNKSLNDLGIQPKGNYIEDNNYVHTDNNFNNTYKNKLEGLENYDDTEVKEDIADIQEEQTEQNTEIEKLQTENARFKATLPTTTGEGQDITLNKTAELEFKKPPLPMGNSEQESTTGKNKLILRTLTEQTVNGITFTPVFDENNNTLKYINVNGTATASANIQLSGSITLNGTFTLSSGLGISTTTYIRCLDSSTYAGLLRTDISGSQTANLENRTVLTYLYVENGTTVNNVKIYPMIEEGSTATSYEPYTGGQASPNPDYPQEITNVTGDVEVKVQNKNLLDMIEKQSYTENGITVTNNKDGSFTLNGTNTNSSHIDLFITPNASTQTIIKDLENGTYLLKIYELSGNINFNSTTCYVIATGKGENNQYLSSMMEFALHNNKQYQVKSLENCKLTTVKFYIGSGVTFNNYRFKIMMTKSSDTSLPYVEHKHQTFTFPLGNEKLMLGDYLADDGIHHVKKQIELTEDNINFVYAVVPTNPAWGDASPHARIRKQYLGMENSYDSECILNSYSKVTVTSEIKTETFSYNFDSNNIWIFDNRFTDLATARELLIGTIIECELAEEVITPYTSAQQEVYNQIKQSLSYEEQTNISSNTIALFNVEAYQDAKVILAEKGTYSKPSTGIPKADLANSVQTSLGKADTALQSHQDISGKANKISVVQTSASTIEINSNTFYKFGEVASLNITLASITDNTIYNEYMFEFVSGTTATTLTLPSSIKWLETPTIDANKIYQCSIVDNVGLLVGVANV